MERRCAEDVFSAERWLASAPLHEAGKTTGSGDTLKTGVRREELGSASDNLSSDPNAYPLISTFSKPHSEVASTTHLPALKRFRKGASLVFWFSSRRKVPQQMQRLKNAAKGGLLRQKIPLPQPAENRPFDAPFAAGRDMAAVTWSNLMESLKRMGCGVNFKADA